MSRRRRCSVLELGPGCLDLDMTHGETDEIEIGIEDDDGNVVESFATWTNLSAVMRIAKGVDPFVDLLPTVTGAGRIAIDITPAMKTALASTSGWWEVDGDNADGKPEIIATGTVVLRRQVVTA